MGKEIKEFESKTPKKFSLWKKIREISRHPLILGIDISDYSIEILQLDNQRNIKLYARAILEKGIVEDAKIKKREKLGKILEETFLKAGINGLVKKWKVRIKGLFSLPESKTFIKVFEFEERENLKEKIQEKIKETVPIPFEELYWDYYELSTNSEKPKVLAVAVPKEIVQDYIHFFLSHQIDPVVFDIEAGSIGRALLPPGEQINSTAIVDIGARTSVINIFNPKKELSLSVTVYYAGNYFTQAIAKKLTISEEEANKIKEEAGFEREPVSSILKECSLTLIKEIKDTLKYYQSRFGNRVEKIILAGGSALLPGIKEYFQKHFEEKVEIGQPLQNIQKTSPLFDSRKAILFANVIGLALRGIEKNFIDAGINLLPEDLKKQVKILHREREKFFRYIFIYFIAEVFILLIICYILFRLGILKLKIPI